MLERGSLLGERILPLAGCGECPTEVLVRTLRLTDGIVQMAYAFAEVIDIRSVALDVRPAPAPGEVAAIDVEMDTAKRHAMVAEAMKIIQDEVLALPLHRQVIPWVSKANITVVHRPNNALFPRWTTIK